MKQKQAKKSKHKKLWVIGASTVFAVLFIAQMTFNVYAYVRLASTGDQSTITHVIINAVRGLHKPAPVEPTTGKVYLPEARLVLPAADSLQHVLYSNPSEQEVQITTSEILNQAETKLWTAPASLSQVDAKTELKVKAMFSEVPNLQACSRGVQLFFSPQDFDESTVQLHATKTLANSKTIYLYTDATCEGDLDKLAEYVKQAESY